MVKLNSGVSAERIRSSVSPEDRDSQRSTARKLNCWEYKRCGRQPQGHHVHDQGVCPAAVEERLDGVHDGTNAGRACWVVAGTMCGGQVQGSFGSKYRNCEQCDFYQMARQEERGRFKLSIVLLNMLKNGAPAVPICR